MSELYNRIESLCKQRKTNITEMCRTSGAPRGSLTDLKMGRTASLTIETLSKISDYFGVTVDYLVGKEQKENAPADKGEDEMASILQDFRDNPELRTLFSLSRNATPEELRQYAGVIRALRGNHD